MNKALLFSACLFILASSLTGCDSPDKVPIEKATQALPAKTSAEKPRAPEPPLDLSLPDDVMEQSPQENFLISDEASGISLPTVGKQKEVSLSGKLRLDKEKEDYREAVEGAEVNVEVKFE